jgi:cytochrome c oxidase assembly protein subunit 15
VSASGVDWSPALQLAAIALALAGAFAGWTAWRQRRVPRSGWLRTLTLLTLFLTFDLIVFGAYTRLSDSGLGCPDWPGCYAQSTPLAAQAHIAAAEAAQPHGPVTQRKAWVEMLHRYLAMAVGALITAMMLSHLVLAARQRRLAQQVARAARSTRIAAPPPAAHPQALAGWTTLIFLWVCGQGAFGALTVTMKLYPAIVTAHLLGGVGLLALLAVMARRQTPDALDLPARTRWAVRAVLLLVIAQVTLGGWVSTNYAVLACADFPTCQGSWWPAMDLASGFQWRRELGQTADGRFLPFAALTAIHVMHRVGALAVALAVAALALALRRLGRHRAAAGLTGLLVWQIGSGVSNVVLDWPLAAALAHTAGAAALVATLAALSSVKSERGQRVPAPTPARLGGMLAAR